ncbi:MAG: cbb3-type cytochrome c oxidase subunit I [Planctomycetota bacterium]|jgi:cytochrome c oxidase subunit 1|nr:cbb3-type cytochrome c oxidase subunit I [Planctomycetota bacterium]
MSQGNGHDHHEMSFFRKYIWSTDHKTIGIQWLFTALLFIFLGGGLALMIRMSLARPGSVLDSNYYWIMTMHGTIMIFFVIIPILVGAFANFLIPLQIGAEDMAFPRLNALAYWMIWPSAIIMLASFFVEGGAASFGWTSYPPGTGTEVMSTSGMTAPSGGSGGLGQTLWLVSVFFVGMTSIVGAVNYVTTVVKLRAPGMTYFRMPLTTWSIFITAILAVFGTPVLASGALMLLADRVIGTTFFQPSHDGNVLLWQHLFWFYSHPAVYIMVLPAMGIVSEIISCFARKPIFGYKPMVVAMSGIAGLGFIVWGHHMFMSGMNPVLGMTFMISTMMIALPSAIKTFNWLATLWRGNIQFTVPMCHAIAFVSMFIVGGLSGIFMAATPVDIHIHDTYFIVAHFHYVVFGGTMFAVFGAICFWFPKMFGRMMNSAWGYIHFVVSFIFFNLTFFPMHMLGQAGHPRRIAWSYDVLKDQGYAFLKEYQGMNEFITICAFVLGFAQIIFVLNVIWSSLKGEKAEKNPWKATTLEWSAASPPPHLNWDGKIPTVHRGAYEYGSPEGKDDFIPQDADLTKA